MFNLELKLTLLHFHFRLYRERVTQVESKLEEVRGGSASEYLNPLDELKNNHKIRLEVCHILYKLRKQTIITKNDAENLASQQNYEVKCLLLCILLTVQVKFLNINNSLKCIF